MTKHQIGDSVYLRRLADFLQPRDPKILPDDVDTSNWVPVIPYDTTLNVPDLYQVLLEGSQNYISTNVYNVRVGSGTFLSDPDVVLPAGYIYKLNSLYLYIDTNAAVTSGDHLTIDIVQNNDRWPITHPGGQLNVVTTHYRQRQMFYQQNPFRLSSGSTEYAWTWPSGAYKDYDTDMVPHSFIPPVEIICPDNSKFGTDLQFIISYFDTSHLAKNWDVGAVVNLYLMFDRIPLHGLVVGGQLDIVPP